MAGKHIDYAVDFAKKANKGLLFDYILLIGSVARSEERANSDIDFVLITAKGKERTKEYFELADELFEEGRKSSLRFELEFLERIRMEEYLANPRYGFEMFENHRSFYTSAFTDGLIFDGQSFSKKAKDDPYLKKCVKKLTWFHS